MDFGDASRLRQLSDDFGVFLKNLVIGNLGLQLQALESFCVEHHPNTGFFCCDGDHPNPPILTADHFGQRTVDPRLAVDTFKVGKQ